MKFKVTEHFDNDTEVVWSKETDAMGVVGAFAGIHSIIKDPQSDRFNAVLPVVTHITIEVIR